MGTLKKAWRQRMLVLMIIPVIVWTAIFSYAPLAGWLVAFKEYQPSKGFAGIFSAPFVGLKFFREFFTDKQFYQTLRNTVAMGGLVIVIGTFAAIAFALLLNEVKCQWFKKIVQSFSYLPRFLSWVVVASVFYLVLSTDGGIVNEILTRLKLIKAPVAWLTQGKSFWSIITIADIWKNMGWNAIIYIAAISGVDTALYEAAEVDGITRWGKIWHITLPGIRSTIVILFVLAVGNLLNASGFDQSFLMGNPMTMAYSDNLAVYVYRNAFVMGRYSMSASISMINSVISLLLLAGANKLSSLAIDEKVI
ncbi:MAG: ABC transporter permease subunit [Clostridiales bacterium]|nr:ABC transporter permease subunit [Clostridiales bacterium]